MEKPGRKGGLIEQILGAKAPPAAGKPKVGLAPPKPSAAPAAAVSVAKPQATPEALPEAVPAEDGEENSAAYGFYRGRHERATDIDFQKLDGSSLGVGYAWLHFKEFLPPAEDAGKGQAIRLESTTGVMVTIRGRNLRDLYTRILRQQVFRVTEMGEEADRFLPEEATVVYAVDIEKPEPQHAADAG